MGFSGSDGSPASLRRLLAELEEAWKRFNRPQVSPDLKTSLYSRIAEVRAAICMAEAREAKARRSRPRAVREQVGA